MAEQLSRKDLKTDKFAVEVEHTVDYLSAHRAQTIRVVIAVAVVLLLAAGVYYYRNSQHAAREQALAEALAVQAAPVGTAPPNGGPSFPSESAKQDAVTKAFNLLGSNYSGSEEAYIAEYYLAGMDVSGAKMDSAKKRYQDVADHANKNYGSLAKLALSQIDFAENRSADAEKILRDLIDNPTDLVSKEQATIVLARGIGPTRPADARKLLEPLAAAGGQVSQIAIAALTELPAK